MKVLVINGCLRRDTVSEDVCDLVRDVLKEEGIETEVIRFREAEGCIACGKCIKQKKCVKEDIVNETSVKLDACDGIVVIGSAVYGEVNTALVGYLDRLFRSASVKLGCKGALCFVISRSEEVDGAVHSISDYFALSNMFVVTHQKGHVIRTLCEEKIRIVQESTQNLAYLVKCFDAGREKGIEPMGKPESIRDFTR